MKVHYVRGVSLVAIAAVLLVGGCSRSGSTTADPSRAADTAKLEGSTEFNDANLRKIADEIKTQLAGKDLSSLELSMVINNPSAFWREGEAGMKKAAEELNVKAQFQGPQGGDLSQQLSMLDGLRSRKVDGYTVSAVDPSAVKGAVDKALDAGIEVVAIDSPLTGTKKPVLYLGTPNYEAGKRAGEAMKTLLGGKGEVAILTGSLTAANAVQRMSGFKKGIEGSKIKIVQTLSDDADPAKALSNAETVLQANPNLAGMYTVWSYVGPAAGQAVKAAGKAGKVMVVSDDAEPKTVQWVREGVIQAMILQRPYQQGYLGMYLLAALKLLGHDATHKILEPYVDKADGITALNSGIGLVTRDNLDTFLSDLEKLGVETS